MSTPASSSVREATWLGQFTSHAAFFGLLALLAAVAAVLLLSLDRATMTAEAARAAELSRTRPSQSASH